LILRENYLKTTHTRKWKRLCENEWKERWKATAKTHQITNSGKLVRGKARKSRMANGFSSDVDKCGKIKPHRVESENTNVESGLQ
jgi:hypothetical protein